MNLAYGIWEKLWRIQSTLILHKQLIIPHLGSAYSLFLSFPVFVPTANAILSRKLHGNSFWYISANSQIIRFLLLAKFTHRQMHVFMCDFLHLFRLHICYFVVVRRETCTQCMYQYSVVIIQINF